MSGKHTPGPWLHRGKSESVHASSETHPYGEYLFAFKDECAPNDADLALILAAPDLLTALEDLVSKGEAFRNTVVETRGVRGMDEHDAALTAARAAIARAGGES